MNSSVTPLLSAAFVSGCVFYVTSGGSPRCLAPAAFVFVFDVLRGLKEAKK